MFKRALEAVSAASSRRPAPEVSAPKPSSSVRPAAAAVDLDAVVASMDKSYFDASFDPVAGLVVRLAIATPGELRLRARARVLDTLPRLPFTPPSPCRRRFRARTTRSTASSRRARCSSSYYWTASPRAFRAR